MRRKGLESPSLDSKGCRMNRSKVEYQTPAVALEKVSAQVPHL